jgi:TRAP transporter TAXI family solute receptor
MYTLFGKPIRLLLAIGVVAVLPLTVVTNAHAQKMVPVLTCPLGCGLPETYTVLSAQMARGDSAILPVAQETPGFMYNVRAMADEKRWKNTIFGTEDTVIQAAFQGGTPEMKRYVPEPIRIKFKLLYGEGLVAQGKFFVSLDPNIKRVEDLKGKRVSIGLPTQSDWGMVADLLLEHSYGITKDNTDIRYVTPSVMIQQLIDGNTDVALTALITNAGSDIWWTNSLTSQLVASGKPIQYIPVTKEAIEKLNNKFDMSLLTLTVPAGSLPNQKEDFMVGGNRIYAAVHPEFSDDVAYEMVKAVASYGPKLRESGQGIWRFWSPDNMVAGLSEENAHPGAIKAFKELGWWENRLKYQAVTYPNSK